MRHYFRLILALAVTVLPVGAQADGFVIAPPTYTIEETGQQAVLVYDEATQQETMMISMTYKGTADEFVWLIPTPSKPEIERGSQNLISAIEDNINPKNYKSSGSMMLGSADFTSGAIPETTVTVVESKQVDYYDATVLEATSAEDLVEWLNTNGYTFPTDSTYILNDYISNGWYFTALKIQTTVDVDSVTEDLKNGNGTPVQLSFQANNLVYPLRISAITQDTTASDYPFEKKKKKNNEQPVVLYVFSDHKVEANGFTTNHAEWLKREVIEGFATNTNGDSWVKLDNRKYYLTKLSAKFAPSEMTEDVFPKEADNNKTVDSNLVDWEADEIVTLILAVIFLPALGAVVVTFSPFGLMSLAMTIVRQRTHSTGWRVFAHVMQWLSYFAIVGISALIIYMIFQEMSPAAFIEDWRYSYYKEEVSLMVGFFATIAFVNLLFAGLPIIQTIMLERRRRRQMTSA